MNIEKKFIIVLTCLIGGWAFSAPEVRFEFNNLEKLSGKIYLAVINDPQAWEGNDQPEDKIEFKAAVIVGEENIHITVTGLKPGDYAAMIYQDLNGNGMLDTNALKIPKEPYGFSNNKKGLFGKPKFKDVSFTVKDKDIVQKIKFF